MKRFVRLIFLTVFAFSGGNPLSAQLCQGSLGDPIVNITFGSGSNPGPPLSAATTSYQYTPADCPADGLYTVRTNTSNCFGSSWHSLTADHTGNGNGYFMLVNASFQPSAFYIDTVRGLCGGTTYEFAAWVLNVLKPSACNSSGIVPNLTFTIERTDGTVLQTYNTGNIAHQNAPTWQQFGFFFATPTGVSDVVLRIFNNSQGGCGNDIALDDITFRPCGPQLTPSITGSGNTSATVCEGNAATFSFNCSVSQGFNNPSFQWQQSIDNGPWTDIPGATTTALNVNLAGTLPTGTYRYRLTAAEAGNMASPQCRISSQPLLITVAANPETTATANTPVCEAGLLQLTATGGTAFQWTGPNSFAASGQGVQIQPVQLSQAGKYYVLVTNAAGCTHLDSVTIVVDPKPVAATSFAAATICAGASVQLSASGGIDYLWKPALGLSADNIADPLASPLQTTQYSVIVSNAFGCKDTAGLTVNVIPLPEADAGPDKVIMSGQQVQLSGQAFGPNTRFEWLPLIYMTNPQTLTPTVAPPHDTSYVLTVISNDGCGEASDTVKVFVYRDVYIPTAFSPNGDGLNDTWVIPALSAFSEFELYVYDRFGQLMFYTKDTNKPWDGRYKGQPQPGGVYVYMLKLKSLERFFKGTLTVVR